MNAASRERRKYALEMVNTESVYTEKADSWSLGCILFEICTRRQLFMDDKVVQEFKSSDDLQLPFFDGVNDNFKNVIKSEWISKMLETDLEKRPSARELADSL